MKNNSLSTFKVAATNLILLETDIKHLTRRKSELELKQIQIDKEIDKLTDIVAS